MQLYQLADHFSPEQLDNLGQFFQSSPWYQGAPGGFVTNSPKRLVNAYGNGAGINHQGEPSGPGWPATYWTAKMSQSNLSLETATTPLPEPLLVLIPQLRQLFLQTMPDAQVTDHTFNIAVCNYYRDPDMTIAAHTDDNQWYPRECQAGPVFASLTWYPEGEPREEAYARFQVRQNGVWTPVRLPHASLLIMPSGLEHRVLAHTKRQVPYFRPRINITFRSTYPLDRHPLLNAMAVANHTRYYRVPKALIYSPSLDPNLLEPIWRTYHRFAKRYGSKGVSLRERTPTDPSRSSVKPLYQAWERKRGFPTVNLGTNLVPELVQMVVDYCRAGDSLG